MGMTRITILVGKTNVGEKKLDAISVPARLPDDSYMLCNSMDGPENIMLSKMVPCVLWRCKE